MVTPKAGAMAAPRLVEAHDDMATTQDLGKDTRLTSVVEEEEDDQKEDQSQGLEPGLDQPTVMENDEPQPIVVESFDEPQGRDATAW